MVVEPAEVVHVAFEERYPVCIPGDCREGFAAETGLEVAVADAVAEFPPPGVVLPSCGEELPPCFRSALDGVVDFLDPALCELPDATALEVACNGGVVAHFFDCLYPVIGYLCGRLGQPLAATVPDTVVR